MLNRRVIEIFICVAALAFVATTPFVALSQDWEFFVSNETSGEIKISARDVWKNKLVFDQTPLDSPRFGRKFKIKFHDPVDFNELGVAGSFGWGVDIFFSPAEARDRQVMYLYRVDDLQAENWDMIVAAALQVIKAQGEPRVAYVGMSKDMSQPSGKWHAIGAPVKWNYELKSMLQAKPTGYQGPGPFTMGKVPMGKVIGGALHEAGVFNDMGWSPEEPISVDLMTCCADAIGDLYFAANFTVPQLGPNPLVMVTSRRAWPPRKPDRGQ